MRKTPSALDLLEMLNPADREIVEQETVPLHLPAGRDLFREGDTGDALYLVMSGSLGVYMQSSTNEHRLISLVGPGETVGEMALISGQPRSATVTAIRDTELLRLAKSRFDRLMKLKPEIMSGMMRILVHRLRRISDGAGVMIEPKTVALLPAHDGPDARAVASRLADQLTAEGSSVKLVGPDGHHESARWFNELEQSHDHVFLYGTAEDTAWSRLCARQADRILIVADVQWNSDTSLPDDLLKERARHQLLDLILLHREGHSRSADIHRQIAVVPANRHFHMRFDCDRDWSRLARIVGGRGVGLVLSGGGARAFAHIGVIRAFADAGIPIDFVGGTSMGAIIGAGVAMEWSPDELAERVFASFVSSNPLSDITLPLLGMVKGKKVERLLEEHFGDWAIPDLWRPFFCISSNLTSGTVYVHQHGPVRDALRASIALPGILPPKVDAQSVLVDGAVTSNLPVDVMRNIHRGPIVAVDVARDRAVGPELLTDYHAEPWYRRFLRPPIVSILMRAATVSGEEQDRRQAANADLFMAPALGDIEIRDWNAFDRAIEIGYEHAAAALAGFKPGSLRRKG
ncbi:MAG: patatin-like phospholipase family protein [Hyphomicrobiales bacterium]